MRKICTLFIFVFVFLKVFSQAPVAYTSADIYLQLKKLKVLGSVLYVAAHPDDENTRLLAYLSKERLVRTGYLSITRGDGGQNLIGDEQGVDLGLIRTQELLAARRIDGAEQFFTRAYDFGFCKTTEEAMRTWDKEKILGDVVWVIRKFQPDVIINRFPEDNRAGHGHHSGSAVLAHEAYKAAADPNRYPEQLKLGVQPWQAKRIMWNTFNFGNTNTISEDQLKIDVGAYNAILGKSYGELAAESRSQHKSQGFGVPSSRGRQLEYFTHLEGEKATNDILDQVNMGWARVPGTEKFIVRIDDIIRQYDLSNPASSVPALVNLYKEVTALKSGYWKEKKLEEIQQLIETCSGLWLEASANNEYAVQGDSIRIRVSVNNRLGASVQLLKIIAEGADSVFNKDLEPNRNYDYTKSVYVSPARAITQPYWLEKKMLEGSYNVEDPMLIGKPDNKVAFLAQFDVTISGQPFTFIKPIRFKSTDPVKGELLQPLVVVPSVAVSTEPSVVIFRKNENQKAEVAINLTAHKEFRNYAAKISKRTSYSNSTKTDSSFNLGKGLSRQFVFTIGNSEMKDLNQDYVQAFAELKNGIEEQPAYLNVTSIKYDHIPNIHYFYQDAIKVLNIDLKTAGKKLGYIEGAGDKVPIALEQMGYEVTILKEKDINSGYLKQFDAVITGIRAYNVHSFLQEKYEVLMNYIREGGNLIVQYNTVNFISNIKSRIGPYPFNISRNRVTDEKSKVKLLLPDHPVLNYPNKITEADFDYWVQERGIYHADQLDAAYQTPFSMADRDEAEQKGSLIVADYGKGKFVYTGLVFFRELPAGVPGAYRLLANIIALNQKKGF